MRIINALMFGAIAGSVTLAQSGRVKPFESPTPTPPSRVTTNRGDYVLTQDARAVIATRPTIARESDDETIKVASRLVPIPVSIFEDTRMKKPLAVEDFELLIDGKGVEIGELFRASAPIRLAMLFDNSSSVIVARDFEREAALRFFERVIRPDRDLAALFSIADFTRLEQPLTNELNLLHRAINSFAQPRGATALLDGIVKATDYLSTASGRRVIVIVSDGEDTYSDPKNTLEEVVKVLHRSNIQVFVVKTKEFENFKRTGQRGGNANIHALTAERRMLEIASQTGGTVYSPIDERELNDVFKSLSAELSEQYVLAYYPEGESEASGRYRSIAVNLKNRPGAVLRSRKGYYVSKN